MTTTTAAFGSGRTVTTMTATTATALARNLASMSTSPPPPSSAVAAVVVLAEASETTSGLRALPLAREQRGSVAAAATRRFGSGAVSAAATNPRSSSSSCAAATRRYLYCRRRRLEQFRMRPTSSRRFSSSPLSSSSSAAAAAAVAPREEEEEDDDDEEEDEDDDLLDRTTVVDSGDAATAIAERRQQQQQQQRRPLSRQRQRPRLEALRERLQREEETRRHRGRGRDAVVVAAEAEEANGAVRLVVDDAPPQSEAEDEGRRRQGRRQSSPTRNSQQRYRTPQTREEWHDLANRLEQEQHRGQRRRDAAEKTISVLTDRHDRVHTYLRMSLTERCNLRCTYCMPEEGVPLQPPPHLLRTDELLDLAAYFVGLGVTKVRLTGGEPTLRPDVVDVVAGLNEMKRKKGEAEGNNDGIGGCSTGGLEHIGMTSNGILVPKLLPDLVDAGLDSINVSLDTLRPDLFATLTRRPPAYLDRVWEALELAHGYASDPSRAFQVKLNCVVMRGTNDDEVIDFVNLQRRRFPNMQIRFIEYMPFTKNGWCDEKYVPYRELLDRSELKDQLVPVPSDDPHDTTKWYASATTATADDTRDELLPLRRQVGFITSMSSHFCGTCNRLRLTADGQLKVCLFDGMAHTLSLRDAMRVGKLDAAQMNQIVAYSLRQKHAKLGGHADPQDIQRDADNNRPMTLIGG